MEDCSSEFQSGSIIVTQLVVGGNVGSGDGNMTGKEACDIDIIDLERQRDSPDIVCCSPSRKELALKP